MARLLALKRRDRKRRSHHRYLPKRPCGDVCTVRLNLTPRETFVSAISLSHRNVRKRLALTQNTQAQPLARRAYFTSVMTGLSLSLIRITSVLETLSVALRPK